MMHFAGTLEKLLESRDLSFEEARAAMNSIMEGGVGEIQLASWLTALRMKGETAAEIGGCAAAMREKAVLVECADENAVDIVGTGGDGAHTFNISTTAAFIACGAGLTVAKHGNRAVSSSSGSADVLEALGVRIELSPAEMSACLKETGIAFLFAPLLHPAMKYAMPVRKALAARTVFNILGPLCNPARVKRMVLGVYDGKLCRTIAEACRDMGLERVLVVHGDGLDEISTAGKTSICELRGGSIEEYSFDPLAYGIRISSVAELSGAAPAENAEIIKAVLSGRETGARRDAAVLSAAAALFVSGRTDAWSEAISVASESVGSGAATQKLEELVEFTNSFVLPPGSLSAFS